jgi:hypothetical protein
MGFSVPEDANYCVTRTKFNKVSYYSQTVKIETLREEQKYVQYDHDNVDEYTVAVVLEAKE